MADSNLLDGKRELVAAFLEYVDWNGSAYAPYAVTFGTKREAAPTDLLDRPELDYPAVAVQVEYSTGREYGQQQEIRFSVRVSIIAKIEVGADVSPETELEDLTGRMIDNIIRSFDEEGVFVGLDWIAYIPYPSVQPSNNTLDQFLRLSAESQDGLGATYLASQTDFTAITYAVRP
jgi:hypothetical protein